MIGIVTVSWNGYEMSVNLARQVLENNYKDFSLVIVNNSPNENNKFDGDGTFNDNRIKVIHTQRNIGYAGGLNVGVKALLPSSTIDHFLLLNNDVEFPENFINQMLISCVDNHKIYAPLILYRDSGLVQNTGGNIVIWVGGTINLNKNKSLPKIKKIQPDFLSGCILFLHREVIEKVGYFDERFQSYYEDVDYCIRARDKGIGLGVLWNIKAKHFHSFSTRKQNEYKTYLLNRNQILFANKHLKSSSKLIFIMAATLRGLIVSIFRNQVKFYFRGIREGFRC